MAKISTPKRVKGRLTNGLSSQFSLCFKYRLENGYTFSDMSTQQLKEWQKFLDIAAQLTFMDAEKRYRRTSDTTDVFHDQQVIHYGIGPVFRIHGIIENGQFVIIRMDPNHSYHR